METGLWGASQKLQLRVVGPQVLSSSLLFTDPSANISDTIFPHHRMTAIFHSLQASMPGGLEVRRQSHQHSRPQPIPPPAGLGPGPAPALAARCPCGGRQQSQPHLSQEAGTQKEGCGKDPGESELSMGAYCLLRTTPPTQPEGSCVQHPHNDRSPERYHHL